MTQKPRDTCPGEDSVLREASAGNSGDAKATTQVKREVCGFPAGTLSEGPRRLRLQCVVMASANDKRDTRAMYTWDPEKMYPLRTFKLDEAVCDGPQSTQCARTSTCP